MALTKAHNRMIAGASVDVKDFGAVGDGVTDDTASIQAAINFVVTTQGKLIIPEGVFNHTGLTYTSSGFASSIQIVGSGSGATTLKNIATDGSHGISMINTAGTETVWSMFSGFALEGNALSGDGIYCEFCGRVEFSDVYSHSNGGNGFSYINSWSPSFIRCRGDDNGGHGIYCLGGSTNKINGAYVEGGAYSSNTLDGIYIEASPDDATISGSIINVGLSNNDRNGIFCKTPALNVVGCFPEFNKVSQIKIGDSTDARTIIGISISDCQIDARNVGGADYLGVVIEEARGVSINSCQMKNAISSITIDSASTDITVGTIALCRLDPTVTNLIDLNSTLITDSTKPYYLRNDEVSVATAPVSTTQIETGSSGHRHNIAGNGATASSSLWRVQKDGVTLLGARNDGRIITGGAISSSGTPATVQNKIEIYNAAGASLGWIPIYASF